MVSTSEKLTKSAPVAVEEDTSYSVVAEEEEDDLKPPTKKTNLISSSQLADHENTSTDDSTKSRQVECKKCQVLMDKRPSTTMGHIFSIKHDAFPPRQFQCLACGHDFQTEDSFILHRKNDHGGAALMKMGVSLEQIMAEIRSSYSESQADRLYPLILGRLDRLTKPQEKKEPSQIQAKSDQESGSSNSRSGSKKRSGTENETELKENEATHRLVINEQTEEENVKSDAAMDSRKCGKCGGKALVPSDMLQHILSQGHGVFAEGWLQCSLCTHTARSRNAFIHHNAHHHNKEAENLRNPLINSVQVLQELKTSFPNASLRAHFNAMRSFENIQEATPTGVASNVPFSVQEDFNVVEKTAMTDKDDPGADIALQLNSDHEVSYECSEEEQEIPDTIEHRDKSNIESPEADQDLLDLELIIKKAAVDLDRQEDSACFRSRWREIQHHMPRTRRHKIGRKRRAESQMHSL